MSEVFDRQPGESLRAYEAARTYFYLREGRSKDAVAQKLNKERSLMGRWSRQHRWVERARAFDAYEEKRFKAAVDAEMKARAAAIADEWAERERDFRERQYQVAVKGLNKLDKMLEFPLATVTTETREEQRGNETVLVKQTTIQPTRWTFDTAGRLAERMFALARQAIRNEGGLSKDGEAEAEEFWQIETATEKDFEEP